LIDLSARKNWTEGFTASPGHAAVVGRRLLLGVERTTSEFEPEQDIGCSEFFAPQTEDNPIPLVSIF
jgi:hypothetical protein